MAVGIPRPEPLAPLPPLRRTCHCPAGACDCLAWRGASVLGSSVPEQKQSRRVLAVVAVVAVVAVSIRSLSKRSGSLVVSRVQRQRQWVYVLVCERRVAQGFLRRGIIIVFCNWALTHPEHPSARCQEITPPDLGACVSSCQLGQFVCCAAAAASLYSWACAPNPRDSRGDTVYTQLQHSTQRCKRSRRYKNG